MERTYWLRRTVLRIYTDRSNRSLAFVVDWEAGCRFTFRWGPLCVEYDRTDFAPTRTVVKTRAGLVALEGWIEDLSTAGVAVCLGGSDLDLVSVVESGRCHPAPLRY